MKRLFNIIVLCSVLFSIFFFTACGNDHNPTPNPPPNNNNNIQIDVDYGQNEIEDVTPTYTSIIESTTALEESITQEQRNTSLPEEYTLNEYSITTAGNYYFSGNIENNAITVAKNVGSVHIFLDNVALSVDGKNAIETKKGAFVTITLIGENFLSNTGTAKHIIDSKESLTINGNGVLSINSTKSAIVCDDTFFGLGGILNIVASNHCVVADTICIDGTTINVDSCGKDILHAESNYDKVETAPDFSFNCGFVYIVDGTINTTTVLGDGIEADSFVYIKDGTFNITTTPTWNDSYRANAHHESGMYKTNTHEKVPREIVRMGLAYAKLEESVKGIKVGEIDYYLSTDTNKENELTIESEYYTILIEGGDFNINTVDDSIHTNSGSTLICGGNFVINTSDDGIQADTSLKIAESPVIEIQSCFEGLEAQTIDISGGIITITAINDGINATNSNLTETQQKNICQVNVSGGTLDITVGPSGDKDGIDSNGGIKITGGTLIVRGPNHQNTSPIDVATAVSITGGIVIIIGKAPGTGDHIGIMDADPLYTTLIKTQSSNNGLSYGEHTVTIENTTISYSNEYDYGGYTTVYANKKAVIN